MTGRSMTASGVRREKAALSSGCKSHPATAPAGRNRSSYGGNEVAEAFGMRVTIYGDSASVQAVTRVNAEQASKRTMRRPTRQPFRGRLIRLGERANQDTQPLRRGSGDSMYTRKAYATREAPRRGRNDDQPEAREGQAGRSGVAEGFIVPPKLGNASGGKGPQFKTDAIRGEGPGRYVRPTATAPHLDSTKPGCVELIALRPLHPRQRNILSRPERLLILADALVHRGVPIAELQIFCAPPGGLPGDQKIRRTTPAP